MQLAVAKKRDHKIRFTWCPAHKNIERNDKVDSTAQDGTLIGDSIDKFNYIAFPEVITALIKDYETSDIDFLNRININTAIQMLQNLNLVGPSRQTVVKGDVGSTCRRSYFNKISLLETRAQSDPPRLPPSKPLKRGTVYPFGTEIHWAKEDVRHMASMPPGGTHIFRAIWRQCRRSG
ncbi:uncharacterized protein LOC105833161 isoform X1 [Monomorium pharaonis]|uniref:uncharacterized protein LOC105833161 isoform X1 n=1 Tax=Monomorium pharaonis TaxID=307658 RepID=UPI00063F6753|nr:uncharacterized protein LOC105833161 isoform X1 [Monomorium pharaonis]XP_036139438.1 uncharacterized protein LOC105833161 isoform X1 [Monomorium pharaonis]XP_036139439.1 uncharacterized protein LOC105833161 isoform X1 [Monomorium pharaonis]XP_036139440.1 uncharacterized protein LOC105833161 isoform X1 [Monomorium pharaonis]XP_036139441.1 uncharacterized protein LOC105833161 isoform X1 [Monomorium pharaonis]XP_036139442.1 uncharacterized protein LOC105833161 isoform X1 [Monomorium pharaonis]